MTRPVHAAMHEALKKPNLKVYCDNGMVPNFEAVEAGLRKFIGTAMFLGEPDSKGNFPKAHFAHTDLPEEVPYRTEYLKMIAEGHLFAMDEYTARETALYVGDPKGFARFMHTDVHKARIEGALKAGREKAEALLTPKGSPAPLKELPKKEDSPKTTSVPVAPEPPATPPVAK